MTKALCVCVYLQGDRIEELEEGVGAGATILPTLCLSTLLTDVLTGNLGDTQESKADSMLPHLTLPTQYHQAIVLWWRESQGRGQNLF